MRQYGMSAKGQKRTFSSQLKRDRWAHPPQRSLLRSAEVGTPGLGLQHLMQAIWVRKLDLVCAAYHTPISNHTFCDTQHITQKKLPYLYRGEEAAVNGGFHDWR